MGYTVDPEEAEVRAIDALVDLTGARVLEIGCGNGRLTWRYAARTRSVLAIDPKRTAIRQARRDRLEALRGKVVFKTADITSVTLPDGAFNVALFSWSM